MSRLLLLGLLLIMSCLIVSLYRANLSNEVPAPTASGASETTVIMDWAIAEEPYTP